jgi:hypothetical protein
MTMTPAEKAFVNRMIPHVLAGKSLEDAARAVLADDERIWLASTAKDDIGEFIRRELAAQIHCALR